MTSGVLSSVMFLSPHFSKQPLTFSTELSLNTSYRGGNSALQKFWDTQLTQGIGLRVQYFTTTLNGPSTVIQKVSQHLLTACILKQHTGW